MLPLGARLMAPICEALDSDTDLNGRFTRGRADRLELRLPRAPGAFGAETNLAEVFRKFLFEEIEQLLRFRRAGHVLDAGIDVFDVLAEDHHVHFFRMPD